MASLKKRAKISTGTADAVLFEANRTCCICEESSKPVQIHHLDGNPNNNSTANLAVLCLDHHHEATVGGGLGRGLTAGQIKKYRDQWLEKVRARRESALTKPPVSEEMHDALLEAMACHEVRKVRATLLETDWKNQTPLLNELFPYTNLYYGHRVRAEILHTLHRLTGRTRHGMLAKVASMIENLTTSTLPIVSLVHRETKQLSEDNMQLISSARGLGFSLAYDGVKYLSNLKVVAAGARILNIVLRYAHLNDLKDIKTETMEKFQNLIDIAAERKFKDAIRWLQFERDDALALDGDTLPDLPEDILKKLSS
jgi:hypothetical protein